MSVDPNAPASPADEAFDVDFADEVTPAEGVPVAAAAPVAEAVPVAEAAPVAEVVPVAEAVPVSEAVPAAPPAPVDPLATSRAEIQALLEESTRFPAATAARFVLHAGWLTESRLGDRPAAAALYRKAKELAPTTRAPDEALMRIALDSGDLATLEQLYAAEVPLARDVIGKVELLRARADVLDRLGRAADARAVRLEAHALLPDHAALSDWAIADAAAQGDQPAELALRLRAAKVLKDDRLKARHLTQAARLARALGDVPQTVVILKQLLDLAPHDLVARATVLPEIYRTTDDASLEKLLRAEVEGSSGPHARVRLARFLSSKAHVVESDAEGVDDAALELLQNAREIAARDGIVLEAMIALSDHRGHTAAERETHLKARFDTARDPLEKTWTALRLARHFLAVKHAAQAAEWDAKAKELFPEHPETAAAPASAAAAVGGSKADEAYVAGAEAEEKGDDETALSRYIDALSIDALHLAARNSVVRIYERHARWTDLLGFTEREYLSTQDTDARRQSMVTMGEVMELQQKDLASASAAYRMALELVTDPQTAAALARCAEQLGKPRDANFAAKKLAEGGPLPLRMESIALHRTADEASRKGDAATAIDAWSHLVELVPGYMPALRALKALGVDAGGPAPAENKPNPALAVRAAFVAGDLQAAADAAVELANAPEAPATVFADVAYIGDRAGDARMTVAALERWVTFLKDGIARADTLLRIAELYEEKLADPAKAEAAVELAVQGAPRHVPSWKLLSRLAVARGDLARAATALDQEIAVSQLKDRTAARRRASEVAELRGDIASAIARLTEIYDEDNADLWAIAGLERLHSLGGDSQKAHEFRVKMAARCADVRAAAALRVSVAEARRAAGDATGALNEFKRALALDIRLRGVADFLMVHARTTNDRAGQLDLYFRLQGYLTQDAQAALNVIRAELYAAEGQASLELKSYREALNADPLHIPALRSARALHEANGEWNDARNLWAQEGEAHPDPQRAVAFLLHAAHLALKAKDTDTAESHLMAALGKVQGHRAVLAELDALFRPTQREAEMVALYEREADAIAATRPADAAPLYAEAAWLRWEALKEGRRAGVPMNRALKLVANEPRALELKAVIALSEQNFTDAEAAIEGALMASGPDHRAKLLRRLAEIHLAAGRIDDAIEVAQESATLDDRRETHELIAKAALQSGAFLVALNSAEKLVASATSPADVAKAAVFSAEIRAASGDVPGASTQYRRAYVASPDEALLFKLVDLHVNANDGAGLSSAFLALADATTDAKRALDLRRRAARALTEHAKNPAAAVELLKTLAAAHPKETTLKLDLARALAKLPNGLVTAAAELRSWIAAEPLVADAYRELAALYEQGGFTDGAFVALACLDALGAATPDETARYQTLSHKLPPGPQAALPADAIETLVHPDEKASPIRDVLAAIAPVLAKLMPGNLEARGIPKTDRVKGELRLATDRLAQALGVDGFDLYLSRNDPDAAWIENTDPATLVLGASIPSGDVGGLLFTLGKLLGRIRLKTHATFFATGDDLADLVGAAVRVIQPNFSAFGNPNPALDQFLSKQLDRSSRKNLELAVQKLSSGAIDFETHVGAMTYTSDRFGLVACADPGAALRTLGGPSRNNPEALDLLAFAVSDAHLAARAKAKVAVQ